MLPIRTQKKLPINLFTLALGIISIRAFSAPLQFSDEPLFLGVNAEPNVFFQLDDSGSMDWSVLTVKHYEACQYDRNSPNAEGSEDCASAPRTNGLWNTFGSSYTWNRWQNRWVETDAYVPVHYIYNNSDNLYSGCSDRATAEICGGFEKIYRYDWRGAVADFNVLFYDPRNDYVPWPGTNLQDASFSEARSNPQPAIPEVTARTESGSDYAIPYQAARSAPSGYSQIKSLSGFIYHVWVDSHGYSGEYPRRGVNINRTDGPNTIVDLWDNFYRYTVNESEITREKVEWEVDTDGDDKGALTQVVTETVTFSGVEPNPPMGQSARSVAQIQKNIANWYSYARRRAFVAKGAVGSVVTSSPYFRFGMTVLNRDESLFHEMPSASITKYSGYNQQMLNDLYSFNWTASGTPLRVGLKTAGEYYKGTSSAGTNTTRTSPIISSCQQNFTVLFTDGYWNGGDPGISDEDGDGFGGSGRGSVSDVAYYFYKNDLDGDATNNDVVPSDADPATYQHMVTFPVAFGLNGTLSDTDNDGWPNPELSINSVWGGDPGGSGEKPEKIDDLWHAAFNSKGEFVAAQTPDDVVNSLLDALSEIASRDASSASVATSTGQISSDTAIFQALFNNGDWSGELYSYPLNSDYSVNQSSPNWEAGDVLAGQHYSTGRTILSYNGAAGIAFRFPNNYRSPTAATEFTNEMIAELITQAPHALNTTVSDEVSENQAYGESLVNYLRGDRGNEGIGSGDFRVRGGVLGDIVASAPKYVGAPRFYYRDNLETASYQSFRTAHRNRTEMVYVGANDGMLHGFDATTGTERLAYVPKSVYKNLHYLSESPYYHKYFVNASPTIVDAFYSSAWHTVLVGALGAGGQGLFALDVTNPANFSESSASNVVLWEFSDADDPDLGYSFSEASIAKMANGQWVAIFGNGYNNTESDGNSSTSGHAVLFIVDIATGSLVKKIDTGVGDSVTPNGLATPSLVDINADSVVDYIYAGDLRGNMWKFDVTDSSSSGWDVAWVSGSTKYPLFEAGQPITSQPSVGFHPSSNGQLVFFGTGKYLEYSDNRASNQATQSFYAIWDKNETSLSTTAVDRSNLLQQQIIGEFDSLFDSELYTLRATSSNQIDWSIHDGWYMDLVNSGSSPLNNQGERQVSKSLLRNGRIIFATLLPSETACSAGGSSWLMELDAYSGSALQESPFDFNRDGVFDEEDRTYVVPTTSPTNGRPSDTILAGRPAAGGTKTNNGIISSPSVLRARTSEVKLLNGSTGEISDERESTDDAVGRQSWRELD